MALVVAFANVVGAKGIKVKESEPNGAGGDWIWLFWPVWALSLGNPHCKGGRALPRSAKSCGPEGSVSE